MTNEQRILLLGAAARYAETGSGKRIREQANVPQRDLAALIGVTTSGLWRWENGQRRPRGDAAVQWAQWLARLELASAQHAA